MKKAAWYTTGALAVGLGLAFWSLGCASGPFYTAAKKQIDAERAAFPGAQRHVALQAESFHRFQIPRV